MMGRSLAAGLLFGATATATAADPPPGISTVRYDENYSYLRDPAARSGAWWEPLKYIPLSKSGDVYLTLGGETRLRYELLRNDNFGEGPQDHDGYLWLRAMPMADLHAGEYLRVFGELISAFAVDREPSKRTIDENQLDLLQAFADVRLPLSGPDAHATVRGGRQMLKYGSERIISNRYGPNVLQTFDGVKAFAESGLWRVDAFWVRPVESDLEVFDDQTDQRALWSFYLTRHFDSAKQNGLDAYYIGYDNDEAVFNQGTGKEERHSLGTRIFGHASGWDWNVEGLYQFGSFGSGDVSAWTVGSDTGYTFSNFSWTPRLSLKANIISGDDDPSDADLQTFNPLFPKGKYFGEIGLIGPYNLMNLHPTIRVDPSETWSVSAAAVFYWRQNTHDGIYDNGGNLLRSDGSTSARYIGTQMELVVNYHPFRTLEFEMAVSRLAAGDYIKATGQSDDAYFVSMEIKFVF